MIPEDSGSGSTSGSVIERRREVRYPVSLGAAVVTGGGNSTQSCRTTDLSLSGARLAGVALDHGHVDWRPSAVDPAARIWISVECPGVPLPIALRARVVWQRNDTFGITFVAPPAHTRTRLFELLTIVGRRARA